MLRWRNRAEGPGALARSLTLQDVFPVSERLPTDARLLGAALLTICTGEQWKSAPLLTLKCLHHAYLTRWMLTFRVSVEADMGSSPPEFLTL